MASIGHLFTHSAQVMRRTVTADSQGGFTETRIEQVAALPCRLSRKSTMERTEAGKVQGIGSYMVYTDVSVDVKLDDQVVVNNKTYEIVGVARPSSGTHLEWEAEYIEEAR